MRTPPQAVWSVRPSTARRGHRLDGGRDPRALGESSAWGVFIQPAGVQRQRPFVVISEPCRRSCLKESRRWPSCARRFVLRAIKAKLQRVIMNDAP